METVEKKYNPSPLGLLGFGLTTILLNLHNVGILPLDLVIIAMGIALGGLAQFLAGILAFKQKNTFAGTAFVAYGAFWWSLVLIWTLDISRISTASLQSMGFYLLLWGMFTTIMFIGTLKHAMISRLVFGSLALLFMLLAIGDFSGIRFITKIAGVVGILSGSFAFYEAGGHILHEEYGKKFLPLF